MKKVIIALLALAAIYFTGCSKNNETPAVNGSVNGIPATTLYGISGNASDYILFIDTTNTADKLLTYNGTTYSYTTSSANYIYIIISITEVVKATLDTLGTKLVLKVTNPIPPVFTSSEYTSR